MRKLNIIVCGMLLAACVFGGAVVTATSPALADGFVVKDLRKNGAGTVRFAAIQGTHKSQTIVLFGGNKAVWQKIRDGARHAESTGCPVRAILIGSAKEKPSLEIYAIGTYVTKPINPYEIQRATLTKLICDVNREYYVVHKKYWEDYWNRKRP